MDLDLLRYQVQTAGQTSVNMQTSAPALLGELKKNLVGIFSKDNPLMQQREALLSDFLSTPARARADLLPTNLPQIEGRNLALSPTQQDAIVSSRSSAALAPLAGLNEIIKAQYGNIGQAVQGAGDIYSAQIGGAQSAATNALDLYKAAIAEEEARRSGAGSAGLDLGSLLSLIGGDQNQGIDYNSILDSVYGTGQTEDNVYRGVLPDQSGIDLGSILQSIKQKAQPVVSGISNLIQNNPISNAYKSYIDFISNLPGNAASRNAARK